LSPPVFRCQIPRTPSRFLQERREAASISAFAPVICFLTPLSAFKYFSLRFAARLTPDRTERASSAGLTQCQLRRAIVCARTLGFTIDLSAPEEEVDDPLDAFPVQGGSVDRRRAPGMIWGERHGHPDRRIGMNYNISKQFFEL